LANINELKRSLSKEDSELFNWMESYGLTIVLERFQYVLIDTNPTPQVQYGPFETDEEVIKAARTIKEQETKSLSSSSALLHKQEAHEQDLRDKVFKHLVEQGSNPRTDVVSQSGTSDIVTPDAVYEMVCGLDEDRLHSIVENLNDRCNEIDSTADAVIITCCAEDIEGLKELEDKYKVLIQTFEEFTAQPVEESDQPTGESLFPSSDPAPQILVQQIHPSKITTHPQTLMRAEGLDTDHVNDLRDVLKRGGNFKDAVDVYFDGHDYHLADGNHRHAAALAENKPLDVSVHKGTLRDAILHAVRANSGHGLKRSNDSKRLAVVTLLSDPEWFKLSDTQIAEMAVVTQQFVSGVRRDLAELVPALQSDEEDSVLATRIDIPPGLVRVVRHRIPQSEAEQLSQNVLSDDRRRRGSDGIVRSAPSKPAEPEAPLFSEQTDTVAPHSPSRDEVLSYLEFAQKARWARLEIMKGSENPSESEIIAYQTLEREYEEAYEQAVESLSGDSDAVQEVRDRVEAPQLYSEAGEASPNKTIGEPASVSVDDASEKAATPREETADSLASADADPLKATTTVEGVAELVRRYESISLLDLEGLGVERVLINLAERDGLIRRSPEQGGKFVAVKPEERAKKPSIEELLKGRPLSISFVYIPGVKGKVSVSVNAGGKPEDASRSLIDSTHVRGFSEPVMQLIFDQLKKKPKSTAVAKKSSSKPASGKQAKPPTKKVAPKKAVAKKSGTKKFPAGQKKARVRV
jgi:hypothetical protein